MKYLLKSSINMTEFLHSIDSCRDNVLFETTSGDCLNLKSQLSKYLFLTVALDLPYIEGSTISCSKRDAKLISDYIEA